MSVAQNAISTVTSENVAVTNKTAKTDLDKTGKENPENRPESKKCRFLLFNIVSESTFSFLWKN